MRILMWDHFPLTARLVLIKERIDDTTQTDNTWRTKLFSPINIRSYNFPFGVTHVTRIMRSVGAFLIHVLLLTERYMDDHLCIICSEYHISLADGVSQ